MPNSSEPTDVHRDEEILVGVSHCLLGAEVRYDGGHKRSRFVSDVLGEFVRFLPVCPEVEVGMTIPRETVRLEVVDGETRMVAPKSGKDHTSAMTRYAKRRVNALAKEPLCGYILKKDSPSCGMERVRLYRDTGIPKRDGRGLFAEALMAKLPHLPVEEEGRLNDPRLRENFIERVFAYRRLRDLFKGRWTVGKLVAFHSREKLLLLAHHRPAYTELGRLVAKAKALPRGELAETYQTTFLAGLERIATTRKHVNVLQHIAGYFKRLIDDGDRQELHEQIEAYRDGLVPLVVPLTLIKHHLRRHDVPYLEQQSYLEPHPRELMLRNHV